MVNNARNGGGVFGCHVGQRILADAGIPKQVIDHHPLIDGQVKSCVVELPL